MHIIHIILARDIGTGPQRGRPGRCLARSVVCAWCEIGVANISTASCLMPHLNEEVRERKFKAV